MGAILKILQVGSSLRDWGGIERSLVYLTEGLRERGHEVWAVAPRHSPLAQRLTPPFAPIRLRRRLDFRCWAKTYKLCREARFDVVNAHYSPDYLVAGLAARMAGVPVRSLTRHVVLPWSAAKVRRNLRLYTQFIGISDAVSNKLRECGVPSGLVHTALSGVPGLQPTEGAAALREQLGLGEFSVGFFGRVAEEKGAAILPAVAEGLPENTLHCFGDGPYMHRLRAEAGKLRIHGRVPEVADAMSLMDVVLIPSLWEEALSFAVIEAMSLGKPVVASRCGGIPEILENGVAGLIVDRKSSEEMIAAIERLRGNGELRHQMGEKGRQTHAQRLTSAHMAERNEAVFKLGLDAR